MQQSQALPRPNSGCCLLWHVQEERRKRAGETAAAKGQICCVLEEVGRVFCCGFFDVLILVGKGEDWLLDVEIHGCSRNTFVREEGPV